MRQKYMGWQPEVENRAIAYTCGFIGALYKAIGNINLPIAELSKVFEAAIMAGLCGFAGMLGKWLFEITKKYLTAYFKTRKTKIMSLSLKNAKHPAPRWFRKLKAFCLSMALVANAMIAGYPAKDELTKTRIQLWCTVGIAGVLEGFEKLLKDDGEDDEQKTDGQ